MANDMHVSATQDEVFTRCKRKWWFLYPQRMPQVMRGDLDFGTVIHEVCERFLLADDTGRVPQPPVIRTAVWSDGPLKGQIAGSPVELYPEGWDCIDNAKGKRSLPPVSSILIKKLVAKAIDEGILERSPNRQIEHCIERELIPGVNMIGKIDMKLPGEIQDHKSTKAMKWAKSEKKGASNYLGDVLQMLDYAYEVVIEEPDREEITLRHNVFCKDPDNPIARKVSVTVTRAQVIRNWKRLQKQATKMQKLILDSLSETEWKTVEGPSQKGACDDFGSCPFVRVCGGLETPAQYRKRIELQQSNQKNLPTATTFVDIWDTFEKRHPVSHSRNDNMGIFEKRQARRSAPSSQSKNSASQSMQIDGSEVAEVAAALDTAPEPALVINIKHPPWTQADCPACEGFGFNSKGSPCRICDSKSRKAGGPTSAEYALDTDSEGNVVWTAVDGDDKGSAPVKAVAAEVKAQERIELPEETEALKTIGGQAAAAAEIEAEDSIAVEVVKAKKTRKRRTKKQMAEARAAVESDEDKPEQQEAAAPSAAGRRKLGYFLYINCMPMGVETVSVEAVFNEFAAELAKSQGKDSYYDLDVFNRREAFARALDADEINERFNGMHIVARSPNGAPDLRAFVDAIVALAPKGRVIQGAS